MSAGLVGVTITPECNKVVDKWTKVAKEKIFEQYIWNEKCKKASCKAKFEEVIKYWAQVKSSVDLILKKVAESGGPNTKALPGTCAKFQKTLDTVLWSDVNAVAERCVFKSGFDELKGDPCTIRKEKLTQTANCIKGDALALVAKYIGLDKLSAVKKCFNEILSKYCNDNNLGKWLKYNLEDSFVNRGEYGEFNAYNHIDMYFGKYNCVAHPIVNWAS